MSDTSFIIFMVVIIIMIALIIFGVIILVNNSKENVKIVCEKAYFADSPGFWSYDKFMGYIDETTIEEVRELAGNALIYKSQNCVKEKYEK